MGVLPMGGRDLERPEYTLRVDEVGDDVPVLWIHHALGSFLPFVDPAFGAPAAAVAARGCRVIGFDLAGHGRSSALAEFPEDFLQRTVDDAVAVLESCGIGAAAAVVGVGFGAVVALRVAAATPRRVRCVVADSLPGLVASTPLEPWDVPAAPFDDGYDRRPAWLRFVAGLSGAGGLLPPGFRVDLPALMLTCGASGFGEMARVQHMARTIGGAKVAWAPAPAPPASLQAGSFFISEVEKFLAAYA